MTKRLPLSLEPFAEVLDGCPDFFFVRSVRDVFMLPEDLQPIAFAQLPPGQSSQTRNLHAALGEYFLYRKPGALLTAAARRHHRKLYNKYLRQAKNNS